MDIDDKQLDAAREFVWALPWKPRPDGSDYRGHLTRVARNVLSFGIRDRELLEAALLHDCLEDQAAALVERGYDSAEECIDNEFGPRVLSLVKQLTTKGDYAEHVQKTLETEAAPIKVADFLDNALKLDSLSRAHQAKLRFKYGSVAGAMVSWLQRHDIERRDELITAIREVYP